MISEASFSSFAKGSRVGVAVRASMLFQQRTLSVGRSRAGRRACQ